MRCSICGAKLKKEGDICTNCYKNMQLQEQLDNDKNVIYELRRKYSIIYELTKYMWLIVIFILSAILCFMVKSILEGFICIGILVVVIAFILFLSKRLAVGTKATFYATKVVYTFKFFLMDVDKTVKYTDIKDVKIYKTFIQKRFGYGDLCIYANGAFPGASLINGFQIKNIENANSVMENIIKLVGDRTIGL